MTDEEAEKGQAAKRHTKLEQKKAHESVENHPWVRGVIWAAGICFIVIFAMVGVLYDNLRSSSRERHAQLSVEFNELEREFNHQLKEVVGIHAEDLRSIEVAATLSKAETREHERSAREWKNRILANETRLREMFGSVHARKDPFTGTEGDKHRELIDSNERRIDALEQRCFSEAQNPTVRYRANGNSPFDNMGK